MLGTVQTQRNALPTPGKLLYSNAVEFGIHSACRNPIDFTTGSSCRRHLYKPIQYQVVGTVRDEIQAVLLHGLCFRPCGNYCED